MHPGSPLQPHCLIYAAADSGAKFNLLGPVAANRRKAHCSENSIIPGG